MIITKEIEIVVKVNKKLDYYKELGYDCYLKVPFVVKVEDLKSTEKYDILAKCEKCGKDKITPYRNYLGNKSNQYFSCSPKCSLDKIKSTCVSKYGVDNASKSVSVKNKLKRVNKVDKKEVIDLLDLKKDDISNKLGVLKDDVLTINSDSVTLKCDKCNNAFTEKENFLLKRIKDEEELCTNCNPYDRDQFNFGQEILDFIKDNYDDKIVVGNYVDVYLPDRRLAFDFNGVYWNNELFKDKKHHLEKTDNCLDRDVHLIHIYEDSWNYKKDIVKSRILNLLGKSNRIYGRKCKAREVTPSDARLFLMDSHIQGFIGSKIKLGLYYEDELVSLMTFGGLRKNLGQVSKEGSFELLRFCNKLNTTVIGGASKLFKHFVKHYDPISVISYADRSWSKGSLYRNLGFEETHISGINYFYVVDGIRKNRFGYRKNLLVEQGYDKEMTEHSIMLSRDIYRIYDSGSYKFTYKK